MGLKGEGDRTPGIEVAKRRLDIAPGRPRTPATLVIEIVHKDGKPDVRFESYLGSQFFRC